LALIRRSAASLAALADRSSVAELMFEQTLYGLGARPSPGEARSWERSIPVLAHDLVQAGLGDVEVLLEHRLPLSSRRIDAILAGCHPVTGAPSYVIVELKQWSDADLYEDDPALVTVGGYGHRPRLHPLEQVRGYCEYLIDFLPALNGETDTISGVAYLHNATEHGVAPLRRLAESSQARLFTGERRAEFLDFLRSRLAGDVSGAPYADALLSSRAAPSRQLLAVAAAEISDREQFILLDQQRLAFNLVLHATEAARAGDSKTVVIVTGGPGSGKSVIALSLLGELARRGRTVLHATGSRSFTQTLRKVAGKGSRRTQSLFKYFNSFIDAERNGLEVLILDEAHRIRETSANRFTAAKLRTDRRQIDELIAAARVPVFLLDEHQVVRPGEMGTVDDIEAHAKKEHLSVVKVALDAQFRCGGSEEYLRWSSACLAWLLAARSPGPVIPRSASEWQTRHRKWSTCSERNWRPASELGSRPGSAGRGATRGPMAPWNPTSSSGTGPGRGTSKASALSAVPRPPRYGQPTPQASARSDAFTQRKDSSTTGTASSSDPTSSGAATTGR